MNNKINVNNNSIKLILGILAISVITVLMISPLSVMQYAYATDAPIITTLVVDDPDDLDEIYSIDDTITIKFDSDTNEPGGIERQSRTAVDDMFGFTESIGQMYDGKWTDNRTFTITIKNINNAELIINSTTVVPARIIPIFSADELSSESINRSPELTGDFGVIIPFSDDWVIDKGIIYYNGGNVGIGITNPDQLLSVGGIIESTFGGFKFPDGTTQSTASIEIDPIFDSSVASNITQTDIDNWNDTPPYTGSPIGSVTAFMGINVPNDWAEADGSILNRTEYSELFSVIGVMYGDGDGSTTFNIPDLRGYFLRGWDHGAGNDPDAASRTDRGDGSAGDVVGTKQGYETRSHKHYLKINDWDDTSLDPVLSEPQPGLGFWDGVQLDTRDYGPRYMIGGISLHDTGSDDVGYITGWYGHSITRLHIDYDGGSETRPENINVMHIIKVK